MKKTATSRPAIVEASFNNFRQKSYTVNFNVKEKEDGSFEFESVDIQPGCFDYDHIVSAIIRSRYSVDCMEAIINNFLAQRGDGREEFDAMQSWREESKRIAMEALSAVAV